MDKYKNTEAIVINCRNFKENDQIITLLTPRMGKIITFAKGIKNIKSRRLGSLQLGNIIKAHLYQKNDFFWISEAQAVSQFLQTDKGLVQINLLFYFLEIINQLIAENQQIEGAYLISKNIIQSINQNKVFGYIKNEISLLEILGFGVPPEIKNSFSQKDYKTAQKLIKDFFESIIEKPLESNKLFK